MPILTLKKSYINNQQALKLILDFIKKHRTVLLIFSLAFGLRLGFFFMLHPFGPGGDEKLLVNDASGYHQIAVSLLQDGQFPPNDDYQSMLRTIGYPAFVAAVYGVAGVHPWAVILLQLLLDSLLALLLIRFARLLGIDKYAYWGGLLWAIDPLAIISCNALLSDSLFVLITVWAFFLLTRYLMENRARDLYGHALLLALAAHVRPVGLYLFPLMAITLLFRFYRRRQMKQWLLFVLTFMLMIAPWYLRNKGMHRHYFFSISGDYNALILYAAPLYARQIGVSSQDVKDILETQMAQQYPELHTNDPYLFYKQYWKRGLTLVKANLFMFIKQNIKQGIKFILSIGRKRFENEKKISLSDSFYKDGLIKTIEKIYNYFGLTYILYLLAAEGLLLIEYALSIVGIFNIFKKRISLRDPFVLLMIPLFYFFILGIPIGFTRLKLPVMPIIILLVSMGQNINHKIDNNSNWF